MELSATRLLWHLLRRTRLLRLAGAGVTTDESGASLLARMGTTVRLACCVACVVCFLCGWNDFNMLVASSPSLILWKYDRRRGEITAVKNNGGSDGARAR